MKTGMGPKWAAKAIVVAGFAVASQTWGAVTTAAWYRAGEAGTGVDSSGNGYALDQLSVLTPSADTPTFPPLQLAPSTLSLDFNGSNSFAYRSAGLVTQATDNVGMDAWVKSDLANKEGGVIAYNGGLGNPNNSGFGLIQYGSTYTGYVAGAAFVGSTPVSTTAWTYLALVRDSGTWTFYVNGTPVGWSDSAPLAYTPASETFMLGANVYVGGGASFFDGKIDEVRVFTFTGAFSVSDLNYGIPEPGMVGLLVIGTALCAGRRRRASRK